MNARLLPLCLLAALLAAAFAPGARPAAAEAEPKPAAPASAEAQAKSAAPAAEANPPADPAARWEAQVQAYEKKDKESPPPAGATLFVGSSTIRMWTTAAEDFKPAPVIARGVGGCQISDMVYYADRIVAPYKPKRVVFYAGDNDIAAGKTAERVAADWKAFVEKVRKALPDVKIYFISIKPSPSRAKIWPEAQKANQAVRESCQAAPGLAYIDAAAPMLDAEGKPRAELFLKDMLHLSRAGYELWIPIIKAALEKGDARPTSAGPCRTGP
ncbi:MAG: hypothetical protein FJ288_08710 [Planctomycetes bacterium]|nr:hypothetical protein [Planctomycetota bacterium]